MRLVLGQKRKKLLRSLLGCRQADSRSPSVRWCPLPQRLRRTDAHESGYDRLQPRAWFDCGLFYRMVKDRGRSPRRTQKQSGPGLQSVSLLMPQPAPQGALFYFRKLNIFSTGPAFAKATAGKPQDFRTSGLLDPWTSGLLHRLCGAAHARQHPMHAAAAHHRRDHGAAEMRNADVVRL